MVESGNLMTTFPHAAGTEVMKTPQDVAAILKLHQLGWGKKAIARELGVSKNTVRRYLEAGGVLEYGKPQRSSLLKGQEEWLVQELRRHRGNVAVVRQELERQKGIQVNLRTVVSHTACPAISPWCGRHTGRSAEDTGSLWGEYAV
jgi:hypothetical protein